jgi:uncharacterized protein (TIGR02996 family)
MGDASSPPRPELLALLRQVKTTPDDETLRLVLADWLDENGDAADRARAALIRTDAEWRRRSAPGHDETQQRLREQMQALERAYGSEWLGPLRQSNVTCQFHRGLIHVETNVGVVAAWRNRGWPQTEAWAWVERARLVNGAPADVTKLAESPALGSLTTLELRAARPDLASAAALAQSPHLANLKKLRLLYNEHLRAPALVTLAASPYLGNLEHLECAGRVNADDAQAFLDSPHLPRLRYIHGMWFAHLPSPLRERMRERFG